MIFETITPPGKYFRHRICDQSLPQQLKTQHHIYNRSDDIKFFFVPQTYIVRKDHYLVIFQMKVLFTSTVKAFFVAENFIVKFKTNRNYFDYNNEELLFDSVLDCNSEV